MLISKTYEIVTPESAENGDFEETGFEFESERYTFKELIDLAKSTGCIYSEGATWLYSYPEIEDYSTGEEKSYALHFDRENKPRDRKYWEKAVRYVSRKGR